MSKVSTVIKTLSLTALAGGLLTTTILLNSSKATDSSAVNINGKYTSDVAWEAEDLNGDGHLDITEIPWDPFDKYENGHCIEKDGTHNYGFDYDENENFVFKVPSTYFDLTYEQKILKNIETKDYFDDVEYAREVAQKLYKLESTTPKKWDKTSELYISDGVTIDGVTYYVTDYNENGKFDLYHEDKGYVKNENYDVVFYEKDGKRVRFYQLFERAGYTTSDFYDEDFGYYREVKYWNGEKLVTAWTRPTKYAVSEVRIESWRDIAFSNYCRWYGDNSEYAQSVRKESTEKEEQMQDVIDTWREQDGSMAELGQASNKEVSGLYSDLYKYEISSYSHTYDIDESCYILMRESGASAKDALSVCAVFNAEKATEYNSEIMKKNEEWYKERYEQYSSASFQESLENTYENWKDWFKEVLGEDAVE